MKESETEKTYEGCKCVCLAGFNSRLGQIDQSLISVHTSFTCSASTTDSKLSTQNQEPTVREEEREHKLMMMIITNICSI